MKKEDFVEATYFQDEYNISEGELPFGFWRKEMM